MNLKAIVVVLAMFAAPHAHTGDDHNHEAAVEDAPQGGILRDALPYKAELVLKKDLASVYVYQKKGDKLELVSKEKLKESITGQLAFPKDKKKREVTFTLKDKAYEAKLAGIDKVHRYDLHITLNVEGKPVIADFGVDNIH